MEIDVRDGRPQIAGISVVFVITATLIDNGRVFSQHSGSTEGRRRGASHLHQWGDRFKTNNRTRETKRGLIGGVRTDGETEKALSGRRHRARVTHGRTEGYSCAAVKSRGES